MQFVCLFVKLGFISFGKALLEKFGGKNH